MITIQLLGGLGNQLFQYALGLKLSKFKNTTFKIDISHFSEPRSVSYYKSIGIVREYALSHFNVKGEYADKNEIERYFSKKLIHRTIQKAIPYYKRKVIKERYFHFDSNIFKVSKDSYLIGYWQSEKYFKDIEDIIRKNFTFKYISGNSGDLINKINNTNSVCVFVRRGEYVRVPHIGEKHGFCTLDYYKKAIDYISERVNKPNFFVFSDDIPWCQKNIVISQPCSVISHKYAGEQYVNYFYLMTLCKNFIISNSTYGWWAAWLNTNPDKIVIAPEKWFNNKSINTKDLIPESWVII